MVRKSLLDETLDNFVSIKEGWLSYNGIIENTIDTVSLMAGS